MEGANLSFYTYFHTRLDTGEVFYVGKGTGRRAWAKTNRNKWWTAIVQKCGYEVQIAARWKDESEAFEHEKFLIKCLRETGRNLVNLSDGGEGVSGIKYSVEERARSSERARQLMSCPERRKIISKKLKGHSNNKGWVKSPEHIAKLVAAKFLSTPRYEENGLSLTVREWAERLGAHNSTIRYRLKTGKSPSGKSIA